jgi:outer membrane protein assembly factor BamD (BamD/ComL family)
MARPRFRRKDLKRPDEFVTRGQQMLLWSQANLRVVSWVLGGAAAVTLMVVGFLWMHSRRVQQANEDLDHALGELRASHYAEAGTQLAEVAARWPSTAAGRLARLYAGNADLKAENVESAIPQLQDAIHATELPPYLKQQALLDLGFALERKPDVPGAADRYAEAAGMEGPYTALALLGEARCREQAGQRDRARELYERFTREFPQAPEADVVAAKIAALKAAPVS